MLLSWQLKYKQLLNHTNTFVRFFLLFWCKYFKIARKSFQWTVSSNDIVQYMLKEMIKYFSITWYGHTICYRWDISLWQVLKAITPTAIHISSQFLLSNLWGWMNNQTIIVLFKLKKLVNLNWLLLVKWN